MLITINNIKKNNVKFIKYLFFKVLNFFSKNSKVKIEIKKINIIVKNIPKIESK